MLKNSDTEAPEDLIEPLKGKWKELFCDIVSLYATTIYSSSTVLTLMLLTHYAASCCCLGDFG